MRPLDGHPEVLELDCRHESDRGNHWHTDITFIDCLPMGSILRAVEIPRVGGDTIWANSRTAYQDLPSLHYSPTGKNLIVRTSQKTDCFSARSLDELLAKAFEDFPKSS